jgi:hypothetical protein
LIAAACDSGEAIIVDIRKPKETFASIKVSEPQIIIVFQRRSLFDG